MAQVLTVRSEGVGAVTLDPGRAQPMSSRTWRADLTRLSAFDTSVDLVSLGPHVYETIGKGSPFPPALLVVAVAAGRVHGTAGAVPFEVNAGEALLLDTRQPLRSVVDEDVKLLRAVVSQRRLPHRLFQGAPRKPVVLTESPVLHACLSGVTTLLRRSADAAQVDDDAAVAQLVTGVQLSLLDEAKRQELHAAGGRAVGRRGQIEDYIRTHLADPDLSPPAIADAFGRSLRSVHAAFTDGPTSVGAWIRQQRLDELRRAVEDASEPIPVDDLAVMFGFRDSAQVHRVFRAATGVSFRSWSDRQRARTGVRHDRA
jgi:AraC-like DNA-binding protein